MYIPDPYFPNVPHWGNLTMDHVIMDDGHPILFVCQGREGFYLCLCRTTWQKQKWLLAKADLDQIEDLAERKVPIRDVFLNSTDNICVATWCKADSVEKYDFIPVAQLTPNDLPCDSWFLHEDYADDLLDYIALRKYD